jgi:hypothetical protein
MADLKKYLVLEDFEMVDANGEDKSFDAGQVIEVEDESVFTADDIETELENGNIELIVPNAPVNTTVANPVSKAKYKVVGAIDIKDSQNQKQGEYKVGNVYSFAPEVGDVYVEQGLAVKFED